MDVIAVQAANKVLKRMNTEYNGIYDKYTALAGQTSFTTSKQVDAAGHTLKVYVEGILAIKDVDYTQPDSQSVVFTEPMQGEEEVLLTTEVVGLPVVQVIYDDTQVKSDISSLNSRQSNDASAISALQTKATTHDTEITNIKSTHSTDISAINTEISNIKSALDADNDGSIVDTIADIKAQWEAADGDLNTLIANKAENTTVTALQESLTDTQGDVSTLEGSVTAISTELSAARNGKENLLAELTDIKNSIPEAYDDTTVKADVQKAQQDISTVSGQVTLATETINTVKGEIETARNGKTSLSEELADIKTSIPTAYDDTQVKQDITAVKGEVETARGTKTNLTERLDEIVAAIPAAYDDTSLAGRVSTVETNISSLQNKGLADFLIEDSDVPGDFYKIKVSNGAISVEKVVTNP